MNLKLELDTENYISIVHSLVGYGHSECNDGYGINVFKTMKFENGIIEKEEWSEYVVYKTMHVSVKDGFWVIKDKDLT